MIVKSKFELIYGKTGDVFNVLPFKKSTLSADSIPKEDVSHLMLLSNAFSRTVKNDIVSKHIKSCGVVRMETYPLPAFVTTSGEAYINLSVMTSSYVSDYSPSDIYALFTYAIALKAFITKKPFEPDVENHVAEFIIQTFMNLFGKKYGLTGSYKNLIPELQGLCALYVATGMMGKDYNSNLVGYLSNKYYTDLSKLKIPNNINQTIPFLRTLRANNVVPLTENLFSTTIINVSGANSLPMFEDTSRLFSTIMASSIPGNSIFSKYWRKKQSKIYEKLLSIGQINADRALR